MSQQPHFLAWFPLAFVGMWVAVAAVLSLTGGWNHLAQTFRAEPGSAQNRRWFCSGRVGLVDYNGCLIRGHSRQGLYLAVLLPFRPFHPPLFIPWSAMSSHRKRGLWRQDAVDVDTGARKVQLRFSSWGRLPFEEFLPPLCD